MTIKTERQRASTNDVPPYKNLIWGIAPYHELHNLCTTDNESRSPEGEEKVNQIYVDGNSVRSRNHGTHPHRLQTYRLGNGLRNAGE